MSLFPGWQTGRLTRTVETTTATHTSYLPVQMGINQGLLQTGPSYTHTRVREIQPRYLQTEPGKRLNQNQQLEFLKENKQISRKGSKYKGNYTQFYKLRTKRSELPLRRVSDGEGERGQAHAHGVVGEGDLVQVHGVGGPGGEVQAHGVVGPGGGEGDIFLSANNTLVETHKGTDTTLNCRVARDSDYGTVSYYLL